MRRILIILAICLISSFKSIHAQKYYITNLYLYDLFLVNPAGAGMDKSCYSFSAFYQNQWFVMDDAPTTQIFNFQGPIGKNLGLGSYIYNDNNGNMKELGLHGALSYEVLLHKSRKSVSSLTFGLAFSAEQSKIDETGFNSNVALADPVITGAVNSGWGFNASTGLLLKIQDFHFGFSVTNILNQTNPLYNTFEEPELPKDLHFYMSTMYKISDLDVFLEPIFMYRQNNQQFKRMDLSLKGTFPTVNPNYALWGVMSFRRNMDKNIGNNIGWGTTVGVNYRNISFGLEWQLGLTSAQVDYGSAYQLVLRYSICNKLKKHSAIPCSEIRNDKRSRYSGMNW